MSTDIGRFWSMDEFEGMHEDPASLHKYTFTHNNPVNLVDPSGMQAASIGAVSVAVVGFAIIGVTTTISGERITDLLRRGAEQTFYHYTDFMSAMSIFATGRILNPKGGATYYGKNFTLWTEVAHENYALPRTPRAVFAVRVDPMLYGIKFVGEAKHQYWPYKDSRIELSGGWSEYTTTMPVPLSKMILFSWLFPPVMEPVKGPAGIYRYPIANFYNRLNTF